MLNQIRTCFSFFMILSALSFPVGAASDDNLPLTVNDARNGSSKVLFIDDLEAYDQFAVLTKTPWTNGVSKFEGVLLKDIRAPRKMSRFSLMSLESARQVR